VFCSSLADVFDNEAPEGQRERLWDTIRRTPFLTWQLVTKRIGNAAKMLPADWGSGYPNVWLISTIVNEDEARRDLGKLYDVPANVRGVSYEPALGAVDWDFFFRAGRIDWLIVGGESRQDGGIRPVERFRVQWAIDAIAMCQAHGVACFVKQLGAFPVFDGPLANFPPLKDTQAGADPDEWPPMLRVREFPRV